MGGERREVEREKEFGGKKARWREVERQTEVERDRERWRERGRHPAPPLQGQTQHSLPSGPATTSPSSLLGSRSMVSIPKGIIQEWSKAQT